MSGTTKSDLEVAGLEYTNFLKIYGVCHQIYLELNITKGDFIVLDLYKAFPDVWKAEGVNTLSNGQIKTIKERVIKYLRELEIIASSFKPQFAEIRLQIDRVKFYKFHDSLKKRYIDMLKLQIESAQAKKEKAKLPEQTQSPVYRIEFKDGIIYLNNMYLSKPQYGSINYDFFEHVYSKPNERLSVKDLMVKLNHETKKTVHQILNDLGFKNELKKLFFPRASSSYIEFTNPVTEKALKEQGLGYIRFGRN